MTVFKVIVRRLLLWSNLLLVVALILSAWLPKISPHTLWLSGFAGLFFPILFCLCLVYIPVWIIRRKPYYWFSLVGILLCFQSIRHSFGTHFLSAASASDKQSSFFTLMSFNTSSMGLKSYTEDQIISKEIDSVLQVANPDILCMQEFYTNDNPKLNDNLGHIRQQFNYPYHYFTYDKTQWNTWHFGIILFSRFPVIQAQKIPCGYSPAGSGSSFLQADVLIHSDTIRIITAQLQSYMLNDNDYHQLGGLKAMNAFNIKGLYQLAKKMRSTFHDRTRQIEALSRLVKESPYATVVCGDLNDTPVSYTYNTISSGLKDAFLETNWGLGRTLSFLSPTLRIDYIFTQDQFNIHGFQTYPHANFEHYPVMANLSIK
jgi:endonuclease/exonuclease/phosphatase family metal-dependent hydrolase